MSLTKVTSSMIQGATVNALDYMTPAQVANVLSYAGTVDTTAAIQEAIDSGAKAVYLPSGKYGVLGSLHYPITGNFHLFGDGLSATILYAMPGNASAKFLTIGNSDYLTTGFGTENQLSDLQLDGANLPQANTTSVLYLVGTYNNSVSNVRTGTGDAYNLRYDLHLGGDVYTTSFDSVWGGQLTVNPGGTVFDTTILFTGGSWTTIAVHQTHLISFIGVTLQGTAAGSYPSNRFTATAVDSLTYRNSDFECDGINIEVTDCKKCQFVENQFAIGNGGSLVAILKATNSKNIVMRDNHFPNWTGSVAGSYYYTDGGGNTNMELNDFQFVPYYTTGTWVPTFTALTVVDGTGDATYTGNWRRMGDMIFFNVKITVTGTCTTESVAGATRHDLPVTALDDGISVVGVYGTYRVMALSQTSFMPAWSAVNSDIVISGWYKG
jgi:hypothetical protein